MVVAFYTFQLETFYPNKTIRKSKKRKKQGNRNFYSCVIFKQNMAILPTKIQIRQMMINCNY